MPSVQKKVAFYHLTQERTGDDRRKYPISNTDIETNFQNIYNQMTILENQGRAVKIISGNVKVVVEVIQFNSNEHYAFIKIGHQHNANTTSLRDQTTLEATNVPMQPSQRLELYTYCYIDFTTCIVSYISMNSAPGISALRAMFNHHLLSTFKISSSLSAIMSADIIDMIKHKRASQLIVSVAVPSDDVLEENICVSKRAFRKLQNVRKVSYTYTISGQRLKNIFNTPEEVGEVVAAIKEEHGDNLRGLKVSAKADDEDMQKYDLLKHSLTHKVTFDVDDISLLAASDFFSILSSCYQAQKPDLLRYIRND